VPQCKQVPNATNNAVSALTRGSSTSSSCSCSSTTTYIIGMAKGHCDRIVPNAALLCCAVLCLPIMYMAQLRFSTVCAGDSCCCGTCTSSSACVTVQMQYATTVSVMTTQSAQTSVCSLAAATRTALSQARTPRPLRRSCLQCTT
jgi:hypothetical protein